MDRCINIDWFQVYCLQPYGCNLPQIISQKYTIRDRGMGTRHFKMLMDVWRDEKYLEIQYLPFSVKSDKGKGIWHPDACLIKLCNKYCYGLNEITDLLDYLFSINIQLKSISRIDICMDFQRFDNGLLPQTLIKKFLSSEYYKLGASKFTTIGNQKEAVEYDYIRFGSGKSSYSVYLYNKTKELKEVKDKPYIRESWEKAGFNNSEDVWRLEFSIRSDAKHLIYLESDFTELPSGEIMNNTTAEIMNSNVKLGIDSTGKQRAYLPINCNMLQGSSLVRLFAALSANYFRFVRKGKGAKKNMKKVDIFRNLYNDKQIKLGIVCKFKESGRTEKMVYNFLTNIEKETPELFKSIHEVKKNLTERHCRLFMKRIEERAKNLLSENE